MIDFTPSEVSTYYAARAQFVKQTRTKEWRGPCPVHNGKDPNFTVDPQTGQACCHSQCGRGFDILSLEMAITCRPFADCKKTVFRLLGRPEPSRDEADIEAIYDYTDANGELVYQVVRKSGKRFSQRRPLSDGRWSWGLGSVKPLPFQAPLVAKSELIAIVEGEKDAKNLTRAGIPATCNNGGAGNFKSDLTLWFSNKRVMILPDNDEPGRKHAMKVAKMLFGAAASIRIMELPDLAEKGDVSDFLAKGGTADQIRELYERTADWTPEWKFTTNVPDENDRYIRTIEQAIVEAGGLDNFWDLAAHDGIPTPWPRLSKKLGGGLRPGEVYVIGGNQGSGKTSLALQFVIAALRRRTGVLMFSMEMMHQDVFQRMASIEARVDLLAVRDLQRDGRKLHSDYIESIHRLNESLSELCEYPLLVSTKASVTPDFLLKETARIRNRQRVDLVVIDHMQLMATTNSARGDYEKFTAISRATKHVAMELKVPVLLVSQTSRSNATDKRQELDVSDLRGSGAIEEDAAAVMLIYPDKDDMKDALLRQTFSHAVKTWLKLGKNRYGEQGAYMPLMHSKWATRFDEMESERRTAA